MIYVKHIVFDCEPADYEAVCDDLRDIMTDAYEGNVGDPQRALGGRRRGGKLNDMPVM